MILAIDTSTTACSVAIKNSTTVFEQFKIAPREHTTILLAMIESVLNEASCRLTDIKIIAFGCGPGSFTGLRIAASVTQAIAFAHVIPVVSVSTLRAMAQGAFFEQNIEHALVALDARIDEIYFGRYSLDRNKIMQLVGDEQKININDVEIVNDFSKVGAAWGTKESIHIYPRARDIAQIAEFDYENGLAISIENALPVYY